MRILMLGGTRFAGRAVVGEAVARGHEVTVFNRGVTTVPGMPEVADGAGVRVVRGDRTVAADLARLAAAGSWDVVVDAWSGAPLAVRDAARALAGAADRYVYVSSRSVYAQPSDETDESAPVVEASADADEEAYDRDKRGGELAAEREFGADRVLLGRVGLLLGPGETPGRLPYWLHRVARGGDVLAPGPRDLGIRYTDVRDAAGFLLDAAAAGHAGAFNVVSPAGHATMGGLLEACVDAVGNADARLVWADPGAVLEAGVEPWNELPVWVPEGHEYRFLHESDVGRAVAAGLRCRPAETTVRDTWAWLERVGPGGLAPTGEPGRRAVGLSAEREREVLASL